MIEIARNVFLSDLKFVVSGYLHGCGAFIIKLTDGQVIHVEGEEEIQNTINAWRNCFTKNAISDKITEDNNQYQLPEYLL